MNDSVYERINKSIDALKINAYAADLSYFIDSQELSPEQLEAVASVFEHLHEQKDETIRHTLLKMSRLPLKEPKTFESFDFTVLKGRQVDAMKNLSALTAIYAKRNLAFIGPPGVGKTHLAMAYGRACCMQGMKTYFLKATELNQRLFDAIKYGREGSVINGLVKPSCLIIDEIGHSVFNKECTRLFFDVIDRRYNKEGPNTIVFTSNIGPDKWDEYFSENSTLLGALDRIFDNATVFMMKGESYRGRGLETISVETGRVRPGVTTQ